MPKPLQKVPVNPGSQRCPTCGMAVRVIRRFDGQADHYEALSQVTVSDKMPVADKATSNKLRILRRGKKTVALVGMAFTSCSLAPWDDEDVEIWGLNEQHYYPWMKRWDRWFQMHDRKYFTRVHNVHGIAEHYPWLQEEHGKPIYMQHLYEEVPDSVEYPLGQIIERFFGKARKGEKKFKYFTSTMPFMMALALYEGFERIEVYGMEMSGEEEYVQQRPCGEFWLGVLLGMGVELYLPPNNQMLMGKLYGYQGLLR